MSEKKVLIVQYYTVKSEDKEYQRKRQAEVNHCFLKNIENPQLDEIHTLTEKLYNFTFIPTGLQHKIKQTVIGKRLQFADVFNYYNEHLSNTICILSNADIYTDDTLKILDHINFNNTFIGLNRFEDNYDDKPSLMQGLEYNTKQACTPPYTPFIYSQDAWVWKLPAINIPGSSFNLGILGCENYIAYLAVKAGFVVYNPSYLLALNHYDKMSVKISEQGKTKGGMSEKREQRIKDRTEYIFLKNMDTICDKYTTSVTYTQIWDFPVIVTLDIKTSLQPVGFITTASSWKTESKPTDAVFDGNKFWCPVPTDKQSYLECMFNTPVSLKVIDIRGKPVDKDNLEQGYISKFKLAYCKDSDWTHDDTVYEGITTKNGNIIKRTYIDSNCKGIRLYPIEYVNICALKLRLFSSV